MSEQYARIELIADCLRMPLADNSVDLVFCSPPYEDARTYGIDFKLCGQDWVDWAVPRFMECLRVSRGLVAWVVEGRTRRFKWSATPALFMADLHRAGVKLRKPPAYHRVGIPGSGGPDWLRNDYEFIVCAADGKLPWSDNTAMGKPPKYGRGGEMSNRTTGGKRVNMRAPNGTKDGDVAPNRKTAFPKIANPGNFIGYQDASEVIHCNAGGGHLGSNLAHENEAPFPESLADFFIRSFCPPDGIALDPFGGSGTTMAAALKAGRRAISFDCRESQIDLTKRRRDEAMASIE